ncbi:MAG: cupin domain-containing protein [Pseudomonadota bacterium]
MPRVDFDKAPVTRGSDYPAPLDAEFSDRTRRRLGDAVGLTTVGVNFTTLPPGCRSALRHWHEVEDEMVYVLSGVLTLIDDAGETEIKAGEAAGFPGGDANGHCFENRSAEPVTMLEIGTRPKTDRCHYPDHDLVAHDHDGLTEYRRRDGSPLTPTKTRFE